MLLYTTIQHEARRKLGVSLTEYVIADLINKLSRNDFNGYAYCTMSRRRIADEIGISKRYVYKAINRLIEIGLVEKQPDTSYLRATAMWVEATEFRPSEQSSPLVNKVHPASEQSSPPGEKSSPYNSSNNSKDKTYSLSLFEKAKKEDFWAEVKQAFTIAINSLCSDPDTEKEARPLDANKQATEFWNYYSQQGWKTKDGNDLTNLPASVRHWLRRGIEYRRREQAKAKGSRRKDTPFSQKTSEEQHKQVAAEHEYIMKRVRNGGWKRNFEI